MGLATVFDCVTSDLPHVWLDDILVFHQSEDVPQLDQVPHVTVLILAQNEGPNLRTLLPRLIEELSGITYELIVINGNSDDDTAETALLFNAKVHQQKLPGYAAAFRQGLQLSTGIWVLTVDGDGSHNPTFVKNLLAETSNAECIVGSRWIAGGAHRGSPWRALLSRMLNKIFKIFLSLKVHDSSSGYRLYRRDFLTNIELEADGFSVLQEILIKYMQKGARVKEVPIIFTEREKGYSKSRLFLFACSYVRTLWKMWMLRNSATSSDYDDRAYSSKNPVQRWWQRYRFRNIHELLGDINVQMVLDVGCGSSKIIQSLPNAVALDLSMAKLRFLRPTNPNRVCASASALPFKSEVFDVVINSQVIEHLEDRKNVFLEIARVLKPGGYAIVGTVDYANPFWNVIEWIYGILLPYAYADEHITHYTRHSLIAELAEVGLGFTDERFIPGGEITVKVRKSLP